MDESLEFTVMDDSAADEDWLKDGTHQKIADRLFDLITKPDTKGLTIGLEGSWGSGKSTVVNLLRKKLEETHEAFVFYIDSWVHEGDYLRRAFLEGFVEQLQEKGVDSQKLEKIKNEITNKVVVKHNDTSPKTKPLGTALALMSIFLLPIGFSFIDNSCDTLTLGSDLSPNWLFIFGIFLVSIPIIVAFVAWYRNKKNGLASVFWTTETTETTTTETTEEPEKTSIEFEKFFRKLLEIADEKGKKNIVCVIDNLDRINPRDALKIWSTLQVFVQSKNPNGRGDDLSRVWVVVPYDESGLRLLWDEGKQGGEDKSRCSKSFFDKSFQLRIEVPKMLFEGWEDYAKKIIEKSLIGFEEKDKEIVLETLKRGRDKISDAPSPREIKTYVNQVGFLYGLHRRNNISLEVLCFYVDLKYLHSKSVEEIKQSLIDGTVLPQNQVLGLLNDKNKIEKELCGIIFNVDAEKGIELLLEKPVIEALDKDDEEEMKKLTNNHENAVLTFVEKILSENLYDCKNYIGLLIRVFGTRIESTLLSFIFVRQQTICERMGDIPSIENLGSIFQIAKNGSDQILLRKLSETFVANQLSRLKPDSTPSIVDDMLEKFEYISDIVNDDKLIYLDYTQLGIDVFTLIAENIELGKEEKIGKLIKNTESLDEHYSKKIEPSSPDLTSLPMQLVRLGCCAGCLQWNKTLNAINNLIVVRPNYSLNTDSFAQCVKFISILQEYDLKGEVDIIKALLNKPAFWHYVSISKKDVVVKIAAYLLAKYCDDFSFPQMQHVGQSASGINSVKNLFAEENDDVVDYFCKRINATKRSDFIWTLAKNPKYQLVGGIIKKEMENEQHWFFNVENPFECFADAIEYINDENLRKQVLTEFENSAQLISNVQNGEVVVTSRLKACSLLLESENFKTIVKKVEKELAEKNKEEWAKALNDNTELLNIARKCRKIDGKPLDELNNDYAEAFIQFAKAQMSDDSQNNVELDELYDCMNDSFKEFASNKIVTEIIERKFAVSTHIRDFLIERIDYDTLIKSKPEDATSVIKELVDEAKWNQLEFVIRLIDKLGDKFVPEAYYTHVMKKPLKLLDEKAEPEQKEVVELLCKFFNVDLSLVEEQSGGST